MELMTSYERKGMEKGLQNSIIKVLISKFESDSKPLQEKVRSIRNADLLEDLLEKLLLAESVEEAHNIIKQVTK